MNPDKRVDACRVLDALSDGAEFTTGACLGWDGWIFIHLINQFPKMHHRMIVPANKSFVDWEAIKLAEERNAEIIWMPDGTTYRDRNNRILDDTDLLYAFITGNLNPRSGTSMTLNLARERKIRRIPVLV